MTLSHIIDSIELIKKYGMEILQILVTILVMIMMTTIVIRSLVEKPPKPEPPVVCADQSCKDGNGCLIIDGLPICPINSAWSISNLTLLGKAQIAPIDMAIAYLAKGSPASNPYGEIRDKASPEAIKSIKLVSYVLQVEKPIDVYSATFKDGPAAYARDLGLKSEIVYSKSTYDRVTSQNHISHALIGLWGHEVGHVKFDENFLVDDRWENEASAEFFAGVAIFRLGGGDFKNVLEYTNIFTGEDDKHPPHAVGRLLTHEGWRQAKDRHEDPYNKCRSGLVGDDFQYKKRICRAAVSCGNENRPVKIACQRSGGSWSWL